MSTELQNSRNSASWGALDALPGNPMMWILIISELVVFGAFFAGFSVTRIFETEVFNQSQMMLDRFWGGVNTMILITSGYFAALGARSIQANDIRQCRFWLGAAMLTGFTFLVIKLIEYGEKAEQGINIETNSFFTLFYLMTGFHALHVVFGIVILAIVSWKCSEENVETGCAFWHMVDLIWIILFPLVYLIR